MTITEIHALLIERFATDADTLRARVTTTGLAGPNAARSREMAEACDAIVAAVRATPVDAEALRGCAAQFDQTATSAPVATQPVWRGAAMRVRELLALASG